MSERGFLKEKDLLLNSIEKNTVVHWEKYYSNVPIKCIFEDLVIDINEIKRLEEEVNKQAKIIQWYEKENRQNQEIIIDLSKRIDKTTQAIDELLSYDDFKDITNASFGNVKEELKFYLSNYKTLEEFRKANLKESD